MATVEYFRCGGCGKKGAYFRSEYRRWRHYWEVRCRFCGENYGFGSGWHGEEKVEAWRKEAPERATAFQSKAQKDEEERRWRRNAAIGKLSACLRELGLAATETETSDLLDELKTRYSASQSPVGG